LYVLLHTLRNNGHVTVAAIQSVLRASYNAYGDRSTHRSTNANTLQLLHKKITGMPFLRHSRNVFICE